MGKTVACIIARTLSKRLPLKVLRLINNEFSMLEFLIERIKLVKEIDDIFLCTSEDATDDIMEDVAFRRGIKIYRGSADAVIERMLAVGTLTQAHNLVRITGDNVFTSYEYIGQQINALKQSGLDYIRLIDVPLGATAEVMSFAALKDCYSNMDPSVSEYLLLFIFNPVRYKCGVARVSGTDLSNYSLTVDTPADLERTRQVLSHVPKSEQLQVSLNAIMHIIMKYQIPGSIITYGNTVKMPFNKLITYEAFKQDMNKRISASEQLKF